MRKLNFEPPEPYATYIGPSVGLKGKLSSSLPLDLRCVLHGTLEGTFVRVGRSAIVDVNACNVHEAVIAGRFSGSLNATNSIVILPNANVQADIKATKIRIIEGAKFEGHIEVTDISLNEHERDRGH